MKNIILIIFSIFLLYNCNDTENKINEKLFTTKGVVSETPKIKKNTDSLTKLNFFYNDISRFLAGLPPDSLGSLYEISKSKEFKLYSKKINSTFSKLEEDKLSKIKTWSKTVCRQSNLNFSLRSVLVNSKLIYFSDISI